MLASLTRRLSSRALHSVLKATSEANDYSQSLNAAWFLADCRISRYASSVSNNDPAKQSLGTESSKAIPTSNGVITLYKGPLMVPLYVLVRLKVLQLIGAGALIIPVNAWLSHGSIDFKVMASSVFVIIGSTVTSTSLWYYSKRYVGELALIQQTRDVRLSVMDFWGNRVEDVYPVEAVVPPLRGLTPGEQSEWIQKRFFVPLDVIGSRQYFLTIKHGHLINKQLLLELLDGRYLEDETSQEDIEHHVKVRLLPLLNNPMNPGIVRYHPPQFVH